MLNYLFNRIVKNDEKQERKEKAKQHKISYLKLKGIIFNFFNEGNQAKAFLKFFKLKHIKSVIMVKEKI